MPRNVSHMGPFFDYIAKGCCHKWSPQNIYALKICVVTLPLIVVELECNYSSVVSMTLFNVQYSQPARHGTLISMVIILSNIISII